jgi:phosphatidylglycerophosphatase A
LRWRTEVSAISADGKGTLHPRTLNNPFVLIATGFGSGFAPVAPGTVGSLLALPIWWLWLVGLPPWQQMVFVAAAATLSIWIVSRACRATGVGDASQIVLDEFVGQWTTLVAAPKSAMALVLGFLLFRLFDITKPWPVSWADRELRGGLGVVADDVFAGVLAALVLQLSLRYIVWPI